MGPHQNEPGQSYQCMHNSLKNRKPKPSQEQIFFNSLKGQFTSKDAFLRFHQIKKYKTESISHAELTPLLSKLDPYEGRISKRNIFEARKGLTATFHPTIGSVFMFGGVGRKPISTVENFCEDTLEFSKVKDGRQMMYQYNSNMR